ncbi:hypothetical protein AT236_01526 [Lactobacillus delbrueckii subsp. bulgaricus]|nr:hypothetical protein AT236_01526 [Lactobacillus delbrueckii subsp. bulgaricus]
MSTVSYKFFGEFPVTVSLSKITILQKVFFVKSLSTIELLLFTS